MAADKILNMQNSSNVPVAVLTDAEKRLEADKKQKKKEKQHRRREREKLKGKQGKRNTPRSVRLERAKEWLSEYSGNDIIRAYRKYFATTTECAFEELRLLNVPMTDEYIAQFKESLRQSALQERNKKLKRRARLQEKRAAKRQDKNPAIDLYPNSDDHFFFIAGYTSGGAPYGVTWEEMLRT